MPVSFLDLDPQSVHLEPQLHQPTNHKDVGIQYGFDNSILFKIFEELAYLRWMSCPR